MVRYSDELIDEIKNRNDIVDVISQYVILKRSGRNFFGLCPFHKEKSPSFAVSPDKQIFHCFGCGVGGNVFHFISKIENMSFIETVQMLAEKSGVELPTLENNEDNEKMMLKSKVYEINKLTAQFYHENLYKQSAKPAQEYVKKRKLDNQTLKKFLIGYSPNNSNELYQYLKSKGFSDKEILASTLVNRTNDGRYIDRFRGRLMFTIQDIRDRVIAFGGRVLDDSKPKYINSSENIVYSKGRHLFGMNIAKKSNSKKLLIVEGYMDAISLHQRGIDYAVASLGTAMTEAQGRLLRNSAEQIIIGYDADGAGQAATMRGLEILQNLGCDVRILQIEGAKDPDEYVVKYGPERFQKCVDKSISLVEYKVKILKQGLNLEIANDKIKFLKEIAKILSSVTNEIEREVYIEQISLQYKITKEAVYAEISKIQQKNISNVNKLQKAKPQITSEKEMIINDQESKTERLVIYLLINYPQETYSTLKENIPVDVLKNERNRQIVKKLYEEFEKGNTNTENVLNWFDTQEIINYISWILAYDFEITELHKCIEDIVNIYKKEKLVARRNEIIKQLENNQSLENTSNLEQELNNIIIQLAKIK